MAMQRGSVALFQSDAPGVAIEARHGIEASKRGSGRYALGDDVMGRLLETGRALVVLRRNNEVRGWDQPATWELVTRPSIQWACVPIKVGFEVLGALAVDGLFQDDKPLHEDIRLLTIIASMIAQAVRLRQAVVVRQERLAAENQRLKAELYGRFEPDNIVGKDKAMRAIYDIIPQVAPSSTTILLRGESGTGKELVAQAIHFNSPRKDKPLIKVNCAALPETLMESELFGHERGAFTGALNQRKGRFEQAAGGTLFLDEIGDFPPSTQIRLLRVLQEREFERVGGNTTLRVDVRIIAATNRDLEAAMAAGQFRQDLYYRLNVFPIHIPPLRERKTDIPLLTDHFIEKFNRSHRKDVRRVSTPALDMLMAYHWPGNIRELENVIERAVLLSTDGVIHGHLLPPSLQTAEATGTAPLGTLKAQIEALEREVVQETLKSTRGNMAKAARLLGVTERILGLRVQRYAINTRRFKDKA
jgi:Nif-specific regulatory protein